MNPWDRQPFDTDLSFSAFAIYRDLGPGRSLGKVEDQHKSNLRQLKIWSAEHNWVERCSSFDAHIDRLAQKENEQVWLERRKLQKEAEWSASEKLIELANNMANWPLFEEKREEYPDGTVVVQTPAKWAFRDAYRAQLVASTLARRATGLDQGEDMLELEQGVALLVEFFQIIKEEVRDAALLERIQQRLAKLLGEHSSGTTEPPFSNQA